MNRRAGPALAARVVLWAVLMFCLGVPAAAMASMGTELDPELIDPNGDVTYDRAYAGPKPLPYLDVLVGWIDHDNLTDQLLFHLKTGDARSLERRTGDNMYGCGLSGDLVLDGAKHGTFDAGWVKDAGKTTLRSGASFREAEDFVPTPIHQTFSSTFGENGYYSWAINRSELMHFGDIIEQLRGTCDERGSPSQYFLQLYINRDDSASKSAYSFRELRRLTKPDGAKDPIEAYDPAMEASPTSSSDETPSFQIAAAFTAATVVAIARRSRR